jgi:hypothetical protein
MDLNSFRIFSVILPDANSAQEALANMFSFCPIGAPFTANSNTVTNEFTLSETGQFFRIQEVP